MTPKDGLPPLRPVLLALILIGLAACAGSPLGGGRSSADSVARSAGWQARTVATGPFDLRAYVPPRLSGSDTLAVYIEGDGVAWVNRFEISDDPTPRHPDALELAIRDGGMAAYLARPCQYVAGAERRNCHPVFWHTHRYGVDVLNAMSAAIDRLKADSGASRLVLIGYSGGGTIATLLAAQRPDVARVVTVSANLDHAAWTRMNNYSPLTGSLNPVDFVASLQSVPQLHLVGADDEEVPPAIARGYAGRFPADRRPEVRVIAGFDHHCCWSERWPALMAPPRSN